jgi:hypothetical protein
MRRAVSYAVVIAVVSLLSTSLLAFFGGTKLGSHYLTNQLQYPYFMAY